MKANNKNEELILADFLARSSSEQQAAAEAAGKTPELAMRYAYAEAKKLTRTGNCVAVDDATVFSWTFRYFTDATIPAQEQPPAPPRPPASKAQRVTKTPPTPPKQEDKHGQLDMFDIFANSENKKA